MFYTIYKVTNTVNGKFYIGKHKTKNLDDGYFGSGKLLKRAIAKYGIEVFHKEILHLCKSEKQMNLLEKILVVPDIDINYNLCEGGHGGFSYINANLPNGMLGKKQTEKQKQAAREWRQKFNTDPNRREIISKAQKKRYQTQENPFKGKKHSEETREKISKSSKGKVPWNKGRSMSEEQKEQIRKTLAETRAKQLY